jgi:hypothetical protein
MSLNRWRLPRTRLAQAIVWVLAVATIVSCASTGVRAEIDFTFSPMIVNLEVSPGGTGTFEVAVKNDSTAKAGEFIVYVMDVVQVPGGEYSLVERGMASNSCASWIKLSCDRVSVGPGQWGVVDALMEVPRGVYGGRYAALVFELVPERDQSGQEWGSSTVTPSIMAVVELSIPGPLVRKSLGVAGFFVRSGREDPELAMRYGESAVMLSAEVANDGNTHVFAHGSVILRDANGRRLRQIPLGGGRGIVLPGSSARLNSVFVAGIPAGDYIADISVAYGGLRPASAKVSFTVTADDVSTSSIDGGGKIPPFTVDPALVELNYPSGATAARAYVIENKSSEVMQVQGRAIPLVYDEYGELVEEGIEEDANSCAGWIELRPQQVTLLPGGKQVVRALISIPRDAAGSRYANITFTGVPAGDADAQDRPSWAGETGSMLFLTIGKNLVKQADLGSLHVFDSGGMGGYVLEAVFRNTGGVHVAPQAVFVIKKRTMPESLPGVEYIGPGILTDVARVDLGRSSAPVLPGQTRFLAVDYPHALEPGEYVAEVIAEYGGQAPASCSQDFIVP